MLVIEFIVGVGVKDHADFRVGCRRTAPRFRLLPASEKEKGQKTEGPEEELANLRILQETGRLFCGRPFLYLVRRLRHDRLTCCTTWIYICSV